MYMLWCIEATFMSQMYVKETKQGSMQKNCPVKVPPTILTGTSTEYQLLLEDSKSTPV